MVRYFWTSYSLLESMIAVGFSWPSITPCCREVKTSPKLIVTALAPSSLKVSRYSLLPATRNLIPFMSSGVVIGCFEFVSSRYPLTPIPRPTIPFSSSHFMARAPIGPSATLLATSIDG